MTDEMKHWLGVLAIAAALALVGWVISTGGPDETKDAVSGGLLALGALVGVVALAKIASVLMRSDQV